MQITDPQSQNIQLMSDSTERALSSQINTIKSLMNTPMVKEQMKELGININIQSIPNAFFINALAIYGVYSLSSILKNKYMVYAVGAYFAYIFIKKNDIVDKLLQNSNGIIPDRGVSQMGYYGGTVARAMQGFEFNS